jgi:hypothetical protein
MHFKSGLLWFDDSGEPLEEKVLKAAAHYQAKHGHAPDLCFVHPGVFASDADQVIVAGQIEIRPGRAVLAHHLWLGVREARQRTPASASAGRPSLTRRVAAVANEPLSPERARQLLVELEAHP